MTIPVSTHSERTPIRCSSCGSAFPQAGWHFRCPECGSLFELSQPLPYAPAKRSRIQGIDRFRNSFPIGDAAACLSLGEGNTPLLQLSLGGREVFLKCEYANPSGSFKDRGTAVLLSAMVERGLDRVIEDSSGNAGASLAAYAALAGIQARIFIPAYASGPKRKQIESYGAEVYRVAGTRSDVSQAVLHEANQGAAYASHAYLPHGIAGMATIAYELTEQLGQAPGAVLTPVGQGSLLLGLAYGFRSLQAAGIIANLPKLVGLQAARCAPIVAEFNRNGQPHHEVVEGETVAEGIRIVQPLRGDEVVREIKQSGGEVIAVDEDSILRGRTELGRKGIYVEPTSAIIWAGLNQSIEHLPDPVVAVLTGSGYKSEISH